ncbi:glutathione S-transferase Yc-like [Anneissia japonica]|uniref:glutathione S-transferase Yc-like n=1 Tax=Anneissia japonica TaxID=1529436 RepID=UPI0014256D64|nr:glutathione S-transferase Yc-like [Anneissia japonica]
MSGIKLTYVKGRGFGESGRLIMAAAGVEWEEAHLTDKAQFEKLKQDGLLMFGQVPLLQIDGLNIVQSRAIIQYLANKFDMAGKTAADKAKVNMIIEGAKDFGIFHGIAFHPKESQAGLIAENKKKAENRYLPAFEKLLSGSNSGYFVGDSLTAADVLVFEDLLFMEDYLPGLTASYPKLQVFFEKMKGNPKLSAYLSSDKRFPIPDDKYVAEVIKVLY